MSLLQNHNLPEVYVFLLLFSINIFWPSSRAWSNNSSQMKEKTAIFNITQMGVNQVKPNLGGCMKTKKEIVFLE